MRLRRVRATNTVTLAAFLAVSILSPHSALAQMRIADEKPLGRPRTSAIVDSGYSSAAWHLRRDGSPAIVTHRWVIATAEEDQIAVTPIVRDQSQLPTLYRGQLLPAGDRDLVALHFGTAGADARELLLVPFESLPVEDLSALRQIALSALALPTEIGPDRWSAAAHDERVLLVTSERVANEYRLRVRTLSASANEEITVARAPGTISHPRVVTRESQAVIVWREATDGGRAALVAKAVGAREELLRESIGFASISQLPASQEPRFAGIEVGRLLSAHDTAVVGSQLMIAIPVVDLAYTELSRAQMSLRLVEIDLDDGKVTSRDLWSPGTAGFVVHPRIRDREGSVEVLWARGAFESGQQSQIVRTQFESDGEVVHLSLADSLRLAWQPVAWRTASGEQVAWLEHEPARGYRIISFPRTPAPLYRAAGIYEHGNVAETVWAGALSLLLSVGYGLFAGSVLNAPALALGYAALAVLYRFVPELVRDRYRLVVAALSLGVCLAIGVRPLSFAPAFGGIAESLAFSLLPAGFVVLSSPAGRPQLPTRSQSLARLLVASVLAMMMSSIPTITGIINATGTL